MASDGCLRTVGCGSHVGKVDHLIECGDRVIVFDTKCSKHDVKNTGDPTTPTLYLSAAESVLNVLVGEHSGQELGVVRERVAVERTVHIEASLTELALGEHTQ